MVKRTCEFAAQKEIGAVGAKILSADENGLQRRINIGTSETVSVANYKKPREADGHCFAQALYNYSAGSISCMAVGETFFLEVMGLTRGNFR